jgi:type II secretory pathway pseudopilin PulG
MRAFTILEVVFLLLIVTTLIVFAFPHYSRYVSKAQEIRCASNMRSIHTALVSYLADNRDVWPQGPPHEAGHSWASFWIESLGPFGISKKTWQCPTITSSVAPGMDVEGAGIHYVPTMFDDRPGTARKWSTQPWLIEIADAHGQGPLICFPDGQVKSFNKVLVDQGLRP